MKNTLIILTSILFSFNLHSQTIEERKKITNSYNKKHSNVLLQNLIIKNQKRKLLIEKYITNNKLAQKNYSKNNIDYKIFDIVDGKPVYITTSNIKSAKATRTNFLQSGGDLNLDLEGENMNVATWDGGPTLASHQEFTSDDENSTSRITTPDLSSSNGRSNHSTHVSGTIVASGKNTSAKGMAPKATLISYDWDNDTTEALDEAISNGLLFSNHSYGAPVLTDDGSPNAPTWLMGCYNNEAKAWDDIAYNAPYYLMIAAAGNSGEHNYDGGLKANYDKLTNFGVSKNNLVVANASNPVIHPNGSGDLLSLFIYSSSSQGPADDGRIKPDISADGTNVFSPISSSDSDYDTYSGTSMATPNVLGTLLLLQEYYNRLYSKFMLSATVKALAIHTADDDKTIIGPDPIFGWGLLNSKYAAEVIQNSTTNNSVIIEKSLENKGTYTFDFTVSDGGHPVSATIVWTDPSGTDFTGVLNSPNAALVNDLDLRITLNSETSFETFYPWKLDLDNISGFATKNDNSVDNVENIDIEFPTSGTYSLTVSHKGSLVNSKQNFSLILTGFENTTLSQEEDFDRTNINIWPNPTYDLLNYEYKSLSNSNIEIELIDIQGREIYKQSIKSSKQIIKGTINLKGYSKGVYILNIIQADRKKHKKIVLN